MISLNDISKLGNDPKIESIISEYAKIYGKVNTKEIQNGNNSEIKEGIV